MNKPLPSISWRPITPNDTDILWYKEANSPTLNNELVFKMYYSLKEKKMVLIDVRRDVRYEFPSDNYQVKAYMVAFKILSHE